MADRHLFLIRNGQYDENPHDTLDDGAPLTDNGRKQARLTANALRDFPVSAIHYSPYLQAAETAGIIAEAFPDVAANETSLLRQYESLQIEGETMHPDIIRHLFASQRKQLETAFSTFFRPAEEEPLHEIIVCHASLIRDMICRALNVNPEAWAHMLINNCGISAVIITPENEIKLMNYNDVHHLPDNLRTDN